MTAIDRIFDGFDPPLPDLKPITNKPDTDAVARILEAQRLAEAEARWGPSARRAMSGPNPINTDGDYQRKARQEDGDDE